MTATTTDSIAWPTPPSSPTHDRSASSKLGRRAGAICIGISTAFLGLDASMKLLEVEAAMKGTAELGWPSSVVFGLGVVQLLCLVVYLVPRTRVLGALLWTGYLGGAIATHLRVGDPWLSHTLFPIYIAALLWLGPWLRDARVRALLPRS